MREARDLAQRLLELPHQLQRALGALGRLRRVQARVAGQRGDALVQLRVVLHRARAERVEAGVEVEVALREPVVVADDLRLGDLGQLRRLGAAEVLGQQVVPVRDVELGGDERAPALLRLLEDRHRAVALHRRLELRRSARLGACPGSRVGVQAVVVERAHASPPRARPRPRRRGRRRGGRCPRALRCSVIAISRPSSSSGKPGLTPSAAQRSMTCVDRRVELDRELAHDRLLVQQLDAVERGERRARVGGALEQQLAQLDEPAAAEPAQVDDAGERVERLRGADVVGRLLAADVLLARLQREHEAAAAVDVGASRPRCGRACGAGRPPGRRRSRTTGRRSRAGCRASAPPPRRRRRRTRRAA